MEETVRLSNAFRISPTILDYTFYIGTIRDKWEKTAAKKPFRTF